MKGKKVFTKKEIEELRFVDRAKNKSQNKKRTKADKG